MAGMRALQASRAVLAPADRLQDKSGRYYVAEINRLGVSELELEHSLAGDGKVQVLKKSGDYSSFTVGSLGG